MRVLVVDDEAPARRRLVRMLRAVGDADVVGEAADGHQAVAAIHALTPDLVFLDGQMPGLDGSQVIEAVGLDAMPTVVFVTAFDAHALRAFEVQALDYLLKPFPPERLAAVIARVGARSAEQTPQLAGREPMAATTREVPSRALPPLQRLLVSDGDRDMLLPVTRIDASRPRATTCACTSATASISCARRSPPSRRASNRGGSFGRTDPR